MKKNNMNNDKMRIDIKMKFTSASLILAIVVATMLSLTSYRDYKTQMVKRYRENITAIVNITGQFLDGDKLAEYLKTGKEDANYYEMLDKFQNILEENKLEYLYCYQPTPAGLHVIAQVTAKNNEFDYKLGHVLDENYYSREDLDYAMNLISKSDTEKILISETAYGYLITGFKVIYDSSGQAVAVLGADMSMNEIYTVINQYLKLITIGALIIIALFIPIYIKFLKHYILNPLQKIVDGAVEFVSTGYHNEGVLKKIHINVNSNDEIGDLAYAFNTMTQDLVKYITELKDVTAEQERIETELRIATLIQDSMLPKEFTFDNRKDIEVFAYMRPAKSVGGDFYDFFFIDNNHFCFVIGDVSGKGIPAALFMAMTKATIKDLILQDIPVHEVMSKTNNILCKNNEQGMFVTLYIAIITLDTGELKWSDAGHSPAILYKKNDGSVSEIHAEKGFVAGGFEDMPYIENCINIEKGDIIYIYTDGVTEAINEAQELYSEERLQSFIQNQKIRNVETICKEIVNDVDLYAGNEPQFDDITMLAIEYTGNED